MPFAPLALLLAPALLGQAPDAAPKFIDVVSAHFAAWDGDGDGTLSTAELDAAVADPKNTGDAAAAVSALDRADRNRKRVPLPDLTLSAIRELAEAKPSSKTPALDRMYREGRTRIGKIKDRALFASDLPRLDTIHQGKLGNCFCLAPIGAMVHRDPKQVAGLFALQDDGTYRVTLGHRTVTVPLPTDAELAMTASNDQDGIWVNLYEKAVGEALRREGRPGSMVDALSRGGSAGTMLSFITGHAIRRFGCKQATDPKLSDEERAAKLDELRRELVEAGKDHRLVTIGTTRPTTPGLTPNHAYAVLAYDRDADIVRVWNPHGSSFTPKGTPGPEHGYTRVDGVFSIPLTELVRQFSGLAFETDRPDTP
ncbi:C2 family cysteine protease [Tundrisphaera sp. TA3]|uniref:C2 family cysteine protease n=1 Tax=Tundrisphaera sp. TA3 TaxID=3435775 RepID=UPI003EBD5BAE